MKILNYLKQKFTKIKYSNFTPAKVWEMDKHTSWGNSIIWLDFEKRKLSGHTTPRPQNGDELRCEMNSGKIARFEIKKVEYFRDPSDMWFAEASDIGYL